MSQFLVQCKTFNNIANTTTFFVTNSNAETKGSLDDTSGYQVLIANNYEITQKNYSLFRFYKADGTIIAPTFSASAGDFSVYDGIVSISYSPSGNFTLPIRDVQLGTNIDLNEVVIDPDDGIIIPDDDLPIVFGVVEPTKPTNHYLFIWDSHSSDSLLNSIPVTKIGESGISPRNCCYIIALNRDVIIGYNQTTDIIL